MVDAVNGDWNGPFFSDMRGRIRNSEEHFGNDTSAVAKKNADWLIGLLHHEFDSKPNYRRGCYTVGYYSVTYHAGLGRLTGALPSGRTKGESFASGITPVSGVVDGLMSCLNFIAGLETVKITNGQALNLKLSPSVWKDPQILATVIDVYFRRGGLQVQSNIIDRALLEKAIEYPDDDQFRDLLVRVSGYTAYFRDLNPKMQQEIINRQEY